MNIVTILAGGFGERFNDNIPKQYHIIANKMVIEHVIKSVSDSKNTQKIIISTNPEWANKYLTNTNDSRIDIISSGDTRNFTLKNVIDYVDMTYKCKNLIVCDAVRPLVTSELIDKYFNFLDEYDAVVTAQKITDSLGNYRFEPIDREEYYLMQSPEGFRFELLKNSFNANSILTEVTQQLPSNSRIKLYFDFKNNFKITFKEDLKYIEPFLFP